MYMINYYFGVAACTSSKKFSPKHVQELFNTKYSKSLSIAMHAHLWQDNIIIKAC
jgi:hypothetical protein